MDRTDISGLFSRNVSSDRIYKALAILGRYGLAFVQKSQQGKGRPKETWFAGSITK